MIWLTWKLITLPVRVVAAVVALLVRTLRFVGLGRLAAFGAGVATGLAVAPAASTDLKARLTAGSAATPAPVVDLADTVRYELAHSPRTWHLPQPGVTVSGNRITLTGQVPHETAKVDLGRTAGAIAGVGAVDNRIRVAPTSSDA